MSENAVEMDIQKILSVLPHRYPFLMVDRILELETEKRIVGLKNVSFNEPYFNGHFPGHPVMPGVLVVEGMAQAGGILLLHDRPERTSKLVYFMSIERARFRRPVVPGDQLIYEVEVLRLRQAHCKLSARALVGGQVVADGILTSAMVDR